MMGNVAWILLVIFEFIMIGAWRNRALRAEAKLAATVTWVGIDPGAPDPIKSAVLIRTRAKQ